MKDYIPADFPEVDRVKIFVIDGRSSVEPQLETAPVLTTSYKWDFLILAWATLTGENAEIVADLWRNLPESGSERCHSPRFGLRFYQCEAVLLQASICWECNNIFMQIGDEFSGYDFDSRSSIAQELLAICKQVHDSMPKQARF
jgi:hypothetical protein